MNMATVKSFVKQFKAAVQGDDTTAQAEKAFRQAQSALKSQISSLEGDTINLEDRVSDAKETQAKARINNGKTISDRNSYVTNLIENKNRVVDAEKALKVHTDKISFLKAELTALETDVEETDVKA
jgi:chromosome segregation ATPase